MWVGLYMARVDRKQMMVGFEKVRNELSHESRPHCFMFTSRYDAIIFHSLLAANGYSGL